MPPGHREVGTKSTGSVCILPWTLSTTRPRKPSESSTTLLILPGALPINVPISVPLPVLMVLLNDPMRACTEGEPALGGVLVRGGDIEVNDAIMGLFLPGDPEPVYPRMVLRGAPEHLAARNRGTPAAGKLGTGAKFPQP
mgnify:CR=1 FL=1